MAAVERCSENGRWAYPPGLPGILESGSVTWPLVRSILLWILGIVLTIALVASTLVLWAVRRAFPEQGGELNLPGLSAPVSVFRDDYGVPQLYASTAEDLFRAQGFVHAQDRFWEMDFRRHVTAGRLAELFGPDQVRTDAFLRTMGWRRVAEQEWNLLSAQTRSYLSAYAAGVNAWIAQNGGAKPSGRMSLEYTLLGLTNSSYAIEEWDPIDSLAWLKAMAWDLRGNMESEISRAVLFAHGLTRSRVEQLYPVYRYDRHKPIVSGGAVVDGVYDAAARPPRQGGGPRERPTSAIRDAAPALADLARIVKGLPNLLGDGGSGIGSNSWVIAGQFTTTGKPLLANDPHLRPSMPGIWYQMGLHCSCEFNVAGFTFSGVPGVVIGHNARIAWGFTNLDPDVTDLYLEKVDGNRVFDGTGWTQLTTRDEVIKVAGAQPVTITVRSTKHGPLVSDRSGDIFSLAQRPAVDPSGTPLPSASPHPLASAAVPVATPDPADPGVPTPAVASPYAVALRWTALDPGRSIEALFGLNRAANWTEFRAAAAHFEVPAQNMVYADVDGNIGYQSPGTIPVRGKGDGGWPSPGWDPAYDWTSTIPFTALPNVYNPAEGFIVTANQAVIDLRYPYHLTRDWTYGHRSERIRSMITDRLANGKISPEDIRQMQFDNRNSFAPTLVQVIRDMTFDEVPTATAQAIKLLERWDFQQPADEPAASSAAAAFYNAIWRNLLARTFDELPTDRKPDGGDRWWEVVNGLLLEQNSPWWDRLETPQVERRDEILWQSIDDAVGELTAAQGVDPAAWRWGKMHTLELEHATFGKSGIGVIEWLFNRGPAGTSGGEAIVNATRWSADEGYEVDGVPSMRIIVDLGNLDASRWIQLTGNSGHAFHPNYADQFELWRSGQNLPMRWDRTTIEADATEAMVLNPASREAS
jgi:penicillin amidase